MIHAFHVKNGNVSYSNRYVHTNKCVLEHEAGRSLFGTFGNPMTTDPDRRQGFRRRQHQHRLARRQLLALEEGAYPVSSSIPKTLASSGYVDYAGSAKRFTAHPKIDPETGEMVFFGYSAKGRFTGEHRPWRDGKTGKVTRPEIFRRPSPSMIHDFVVTRNHRAVPGPAAHRLTGARHDAAGRAFAWEPDKGSHIGVMRRDGDVDTDPLVHHRACYVFHPMNMWEEGDKIFAHVMEYERRAAVPECRRLARRNSPGEAGAVDLRPRRTTLTR